MKKIAILFSSLCLGLLFTGMAHCAPASEATLSSVTALGQAISDRTILPGNPSADNLDLELELILQMREGLANVIAYMANNPDLFPLRKPEQRVLTASQRQEIRDVWGSFLDYLLMVDASWQRLNEIDEDSLQTKLEKSRVFATRYAAFLTSYRYALEFIRHADADASVRIELNEPIAEIGLPEDSYADFKHRFLHVAIASKFALQAIEYSAQHASGTAGATGTQGQITLAIREDSQYLREAGRTHGILNTLRNAGQITKERSFRLFFPIQKGVSEWMGQTRVASGDNFLMSSSQIAALRPRLCPGDILLERREWYLSNIGLPGYWPHAAIFIGTGPERAAYFDTPEIRTWVQSQGIADGNYETLLKTRYPDVYLQSGQVDATGAITDVIEAIGRGVVFTTLDHSAAADSLAVLRPRRSRLEIAQAILKSFSYAGRPYDFNFDFRTDGQLVCTELVYKSFQPEAGQQGLDWPLGNILGRPVLTANNIVRHFDKTWQTPAQQLDLIAFFDGNAHSGQAEESDLESFRTSWQRPKWHILITEAEPDPDPDGQE